MLTARGWWFGSALMLVTILGIAGLGHWSAAVPLVGLTLLAWFLLEWGRFAVGFRSTATALRVDRRVTQAGREVPAVWSKTPIRVRAELAAGEGVGIEFVIADDIIAGNEHDSTSDTRRAFGPTTPGRPLVIEYEIRCESPGVLRFEGVQVRISDFNGFFYRRILVRSVEEYLVLPSLTDDRGRQSGRKRFNTLPPPGLHRLRRPGSGSELLDLREYRPGDPPKTIAWRPSARRDMLITREFESEVPVRSLLLLDASDETRVSDAAGTPLARMTEVAAAIAQTATGNRDHIGLTVFDELTAEHIPPARTSSHLVRITRKLAETAGRLPIRSTTDVVSLTNSAYPVAQLNYPDLVAADINTRPIGLFWQALSDSRMFLAVIALIAWPTLLLYRPIPEALARVSDMMSQSGRGWQILLAMVVVPGWVGGLLWLFHGARGLVGTRAGQMSRRKQLAAVYALLDAGGPGDLEHHLNDDMAFADRSRRFLADHRVRPVAPVGGESGNSADKIAIVARALQAVVGRARDNELYVMFLDLLSAEHSLAPLLAAARMARARHHQVLVVVPWPAFPTPIWGAKARYADVAAAAAEQRCRRRFDHVRRELGSAGVPVTRADAGGTVRTVLEQMDRIRGVRVR